MRRHLFSSASGAFAGKACAALSAALALSAAAPAFAQVPMDPLDDRSARRLDRMEQALREIRAIVFQGRETGKPVTVQPADTDSQFTAINQKLNDLEQTVTRINGQLEVTGHLLDQAHHDADQLREDNGALKDRLAQLQQKLDQMQAASGPPTPPAPPAGQATGATPAAPGPPSPTEDPAAAFASARQAYAARDFTTAEAGFKDYVTRFAGQPREPEARYYLGKLLLMRQAYADAAAADVAAVRQWPQTSWAPDAVLDLSRALIGMNQTQDACQALGELARRYPRASVEVRKGAAEARTQAQCSA